jgi:hypothetical protein
MSRNSPPPLLALLAMIVGLSFSASMARADSGEGESPIEPWDARALARLQPMSAIGNDAVRFSKTPSLGGPGWVLELHRLGDGGAIGVVTFVYATREIDGDNLGSLRVGLRRGEYDALIGKIDALMAAGDPPTPPLRGAHGELGRFFVCTDGPGYLTERRLDGRTHWLSGDCAPHPNNQIVKLMWEVVVANLCGYEPAGRPCADVVRRRGRR